MFLKRGFLPNKKKIKNRFFASHYKYHRNESHYTVPMQEKSLTEYCKAFGPKEWAQVLFMVLILCAGGYLIVYSVLTMTMDRDPAMFMFAIAMFGVGCTTIWFALSHVEIQSTEEKLESITTRLDRIIEKIEKQ
jgi:hypothetical protein